MSDNLGEKIKLARKEKKLTQKALGDLMNKSYEAIRKYENGERQPPLSVIKQLSEVLDVPMNNLLGDDYSTSVFSEPFRKDSAIYSSISQMIEACGYRIKYEDVITTCGSQEYVEEQTELFYSDKSNIILDLIDLDNKVIPVSIADWDNLKYNVENFLQFELFNLKNKCDK